jgi:hypothetical protein
MPVSLLNSRVLKISSLFTSTIATAFPSVSETYTLWNGGAVGFSGRCKAFDHAHASQIHDANLFLTPIGSVDLAKTRYVFQSSDSWYARDRFHYLVGSYIDDIQDAWAEMGRKQIVVFIIHRQVVEALSLS